MLLSGEVLVLEKLVQGFCTIVRFHSCMVYSVSVCSSPSLLEKFSVNNGDFPGNLLVVTTYVNTILPQACLTRYYSTILISVVLPQI